MGHCVGGTSGVAPPALVLAVFGFVRAVGALSSGKRQGWAGVRRGPRGGGHFVRVPVARAEAHGRSRPRSGKWSSPPRCARLPT